MNYIAAYFASFVLFVAVDLTWLSAMAGRLYRPTMGDIALVDVNLPPAVIFYVLYPIGLMVFAVAPAVRGGTMGSAALYGALFGFFTYATYDLTNHATLRNWSTLLTVVDTGWGTILAATAAAVGFWVANRLA